jgi:hypothetical protein
MQSVQWKNEQISRLLRENVLQSEGEDGDALKLGEFAFVLFLEPSEEADSNSNSTIGERMVTKAIKFFSQKPTLMHVEIIIPPFVDETSEKVHFATYLGSSADYQNQVDKISAVDFYLIKHGRQWRCLPIFGRDAVQKLIESCDRNVGSPYSLMKYPTSSHLFRNLSWVWKEGPGRSGHCATITTRVLQEAGIKCGLDHPPCWYSPSSLYSSISNDIYSRVCSSTIPAIKGLSPCDEKEENECEESIESILRGRLSAQTMAELGHAKCVRAINKLTMNVLEAHRRGVAANAHTEEKELADALLKWLLVGR